VLLKAAYVLAVDIGNEELAENREQVFQVRFFDCYATRCERGLIEREPFISSHAEEARERTLLQSVIAFLEVTAAAFSARRAISFERVLADSRTF
jgi:hypothetical protein